MKKLSLLLAFVFSAALAYAQRNISGKVTDDQGKGIGNVSIIVKGTLVGGTTRTDGTYSLALPPGGRSLVFSYVGMADQEVTIGSSNTANVTLLTLDKAMKEVIVVGYGTVKKGDFTGSANQTTYEDFKNRPILNPLNALVATGPGVQTTAAGGAPGSSPGIRIRGFGSIGAGSNPLIVVDGVAYDGGMANLNTEDIETVTALKDASTVALWGSRASNGVILITTKRGKKNRNNVSFKVLQGFSNRGLPEYERVNAFQYYPLMWEALKNSLIYSSGQTPAVAAQNATNQIKTQLGYNPFNVVATDIVRTDGSLNPNAQLLWADDLDWTKDLVRQGSRQEYALSYSGGNEKSDYFGSFGYVNEKGFIIRSDFRRFSGRLNMNTQPLKWFKTGLNISAAVNNSNQASDGSNTGFVNPFFFTRTIGPIYPVYAHDPTTGAYLINAQGQRFYDYGNMGSLGLPNRAAGGYPGRHAIEETKLNQSSFKRNTLSGRAYTTLIFTQWLKFTSNIAIDITDFNSSTYENTKVGDGAPAGRASKNNQKTTSYTFNQLLEFEKKFGDHHITLLAAHENYDYNFNLLSGQKQGQVLEGGVEFPNFSTINSINSRVDNYRIESFFSRLNYDLQGKYFLSANLRRDGNSRFSAVSRWDNFWGIGVAWRIEKERFMERVGFINSLKLRSSYGQIGNDNVLDAAGGNNYFGYPALYSLGFNNALEPGAVENQLENLPLHWESNNPFDLGIDFSMFKNRLRGTIEFYRRVSTGLIFNVQLPQSIGGFVVPTNIGNMYNQGFEVEIGGDVIRNKNFNWEAKLNASTIKNRITKMPPATPEQINGTKKLAVGHSIFDYWLREWYGVDPADGAGLFRANTWVPATSRIFTNAKGFKDTATTDVNNARLHYAGSAIPKVFGGLENTFTYKGIELSFLLQYQIGGKVYDGGYAQLVSPGTYGSALSIDMVNAWRNPGDITNIPRMQASATGIYDAQSDRFLIDASFLNVRSITLSAKMPQFVTTRMKATDASFFIGAENVFLFSKRKGMNVNQAFTGVTSNVFTPARIITAGITVNY